MIKVKICGFTNAEDIVNACAAGADMIGVIVDTSSPRSITPAQAKTLLASVPKSVVRVVGTIPMDVDHALRIARELEPDYLQIHAPMKVAELEEIRSASKVQIIAVVGVPSRVKEERKIIAQAREVARVADLVLVDTKKKGMGGGTGLTHDWKISRLVRERIDKPLILSGGLNPLNVKKAIEVVKPFGVDVAGGVESKPGKKDPELVKKFIQSVRGTNLGNEKSY